MSELVCEDAARLVLEAFPEAVLVCANGYISREVFNLDDRPGNFYMLGSMGLGPSIALGAALAQPERTVVVLDGDGNVLMGLGALTVIGAERPANLVHVVLDNGVYASTGNQRTVSSSADLATIARGAGYAHTADARGAEVAGAVEALRAAPRPSFLRVRIAPEPHPRDFPRVSHTPVEIRDRFQAALRSS